MKLPEDIQEAVSLKIESLKDEIAKKEIFGREARRYADKELKKWVHRFWGNKKKKESENYDGCQFCGKCCQYEDAGEMIKCPMLTEKNLCSIYDTRLGTQLATKKNGEIVYCGPRGNHPHQIDSCGYDK